MPVRFETFGTPAKLDPAVEHDILMVAREAVYNAARKAGQSRVYWLTHETNRTARMLYDQVAEKSGFILYRKDV